MKTDGIRLWELSSDILSLEMAISSIVEDEVTTDEFKDRESQKVFQKWLEGNEKFDLKADNLCSYVQHQKRIIEARKEEIKRLQELNKIDQNKTDRLKDYLLNEMKRVGKLKIEGVRHKISVTKGRKRIEITVSDLEFDVPAQFLKREVSVDKRKVVEAMKEEGVTEFDFAKLIPGNDSLRVR